MIYPKFLKDNDVIGITAPSSGVGDKIAEYEKSISVFQNYKIIETPSVRNTGIISNTSDIRANEFNELITRDDINMILIARGGEFLFESLPSLKLNEILNHNKWIMGYSDPTSILFSITTKYDIATIYGFNSTSYDIPHKCVNDNLNIIKGNLVHQHSYDEKYMSDGILPRTCISNKKEFQTSGRIIGGCVEVLNELAGTNYADVESFNNRYIKDGIIWYFDIYEYNANEFYRILLKFKYMGWFQNVKCVILGSINERIEDYITYEEAIERVFKDVLYVSDTSLGHTFPKLTIINGSICNLNFSNNSLDIEFILK